MQGKLSLTFWKGKTMANEKNDEKKVRRTWLWHYNNQKDGKDFDPKKFAGRLAAERLETAKNAISSIASPFLSSEVKLPCSDKGISVIVAQLKAAIEKLEADLTVRKRAVKTTDIIEM